MNLQNDDPLKMYLRELANIQPLSKEEEANYIISWGIKMNKRSLRPGDWLKASFP